MKKYTIGGKKRKIQFGLGAISIYCDLSGGDIELIDEIFTSHGIRQTTLITNLVYAGLCNACNIGANGIKDDIDFTVSEVQMWIDEMDQDELTRIMTSFMESKYMGKTIAQYYEAIDDTDVKSDSKKK